MLRTQANANLFHQYSVAVTTLDRPAAAPQTGDFGLGYKIIGNPDFVVGITASATIFVSSTGGSVFLPVISEMRNPKEYRKAVYICMLIVTASYLSMSMVVYRWCGKWVAAPSLGVCPHSVHHCTTSLTSCFSIIERRSNNEENLIRCRLGWSHHQRHGLPSRKLDPFIRGICPVTFPGLTMNELPRFPPSTYLYVFCVIPSIFRRTLSYTGLCGCKLCPGLHVLIHLECLFS